MNWIEDIIASYQDAFDSLHYCDNCGDCPHATVDGRLRCVNCGEDGGKALKRARRKLMSGLAQCTASQQLLFKRMYANDNLGWPMEKVVDCMNEEKLDWAMQQVQRTLDKKGITNRRYP